MAIYVIGTAVHPATSILFGMVYVILAKLFDFDTRLILAIVIYFFMLWVAILLVRFTCCWPRNDRGENRQSGLGRAACASYHLRS